MLAWGYRKQNLLKELIAYQADILCLQEVQSNHFLDFLAPKLQEVGYSAIYKKKTTEIYAGNSYAIDGCATFFRRERFALVKKYEVRLAVITWHLCLNLLTAWCRPVAMAPGPTRLFASPSCTCVCEAELICWASMYQCDGVLHTNDF